jgi:hypothetical protein
VITIVMTMPFNHAPPSSVFTYVLGVFFAPPYNSPGRTHGPCTTSHVNDEQSMISLAR